MVIENHIIESNIQRQEYLYKDHIPLAIIAAISMFIIGYIFSLWYLGAYYLGDQLHYANFYEALYRSSPNHWAEIQKLYLGSSEPLYRYIMGAAAYAGIERIPYLALWNGVLTGALGYISVKFRCSILFSIFLFSNYYLLVILGPAERLKFAYIMLIISFSINSVKIKYVLSIVSIFFHAQAIVQFAASLGYYITENRKFIFKSPIRTIILSFLSIAILLLTIYLFINYLGGFILSKSEIYYHRSNGILEIIQWAMILFGGLFVFRNKLAYFVGMFPMGILTALFGNRINIATLAFFASMAIMQRKTANPLVLAVMGYMSYKSISFLVDVIHYGTGYAS